MKYYQAVYQMDSHGINKIYSRNIWSKEKDAYEFLEEMRKLLGEAIYDNWVIELFLDEA